MEWMAKGDVWFSPVYHDGWWPGPDSAELRTWVTDETELGARVANKFIDHGRCPLGALDDAESSVAHARFPDPEDAPKRVEAMAARKAHGRQACLCQDLSHFRRVFSDGGGIHSPHPVGKALSGLFWTCMVQVRSS